jgi:hypothetical protein
MTGEGAGPSRRTLSANLETVLQAVFSLALVAIVAVWIVALAGWSGLLALVVRVDTLPRVDTARQVVSVFGVGLTIACGVLWLGNERGVFRLPPGTTKALWVTLVAGVLATSAALFKEALANPSAPSKTCGEPDGPTKQPPGSPAAPRPRVVLMDSRLPKYVYDRASARSGRGNADDIGSALRNMEIDTVVEPTSQGWDRYSEVERLDPRLIIIHYHAFESAAGLDALMKWLSQSAAVQGTRVLVYSRTPGFEDADRSGLRARYEKRFPRLVNRLFFLGFGDASQASFRDTTTIQALRQQVERILKPETSHPTDKT